MSYLYTYVQINNPPDIRIGYSVNMISTNPVNKMLYIE